ncbi:hypothetical protein I3843_15G041500 [Carya illinoinensis]|uniref:peamaclein-like isoform X1 n=1 Tax=Carya illinoinensis TaxID=32201 RepID=UPI001BF7EDA1|nr:peamaclein-like isoform X1 [Carya illinoinensis]KAG2666207.1 hypothetical protein I3760_15G045100 [Carya illinoinensis]KAG7943485.1 hypothetical protein I3843_15G041500 [Carya illinoinensis]
MKPVFATFLLVCLILGSSFFEATEAGSNGLLKYQKNQGFCDSKCAARCAKAGVQDRCLKYCGICCEKCQCVPSGTYGNKHECPCYRDLKNSKGKSKCP